MSQRWPVHGGCSLHCSKRTAEQAGHAGLDRIHRMLNGIEWDADEVLDDVRDYAVEHLRDQDGVLIRTAPDT